MHCLVTGASRGLGLEVVKQLLEQNWTVVATSRTLSPGLQELMDKSDGRLRYFSCDLSAANESVAEALKENLPTELVIDGLVNNAAVAYDDLVTNANADKLATMMQVNVTGPIMVTKFVLRRMLLHSTRGSIVHVSSVSAHRGYRGLAMYAATKAALEGFSKGVAREWGRLGIRSNCVVPGFMETDMSRDLDESQREQVFRRTALGEPTDLASVAQTVQFLLSSESHSITGTAVHVDAGT